jgi:t-SNARE complex subunit (syntaxin)
MFDDVRTLVKGQQPMIDRMTANIERTRDNVQLVLTVAATSAHVACCQPT